MSIQSTTQNIQQFTDSMKKLGVHVSNVKSMGLLLLKYIRGECLFQDTQTIFCRGLILDADNFQPICVPPEKSQKFPYFLQNIEDWGKVIIEEFIDGTMINVFFHGGDWHISTRSKIGAKCKWFSDKNFAEMFDEAKGGLDFEKMNPELTYSFVLRHPENRIVTKYDNADLVLVQVRKGFQEIDTYEIYEELKSIGMEFVVPKRYSHSTLESVLEQIAEMSYEDQGLVFKANGVRSKLRNDKYNSVKQLRGNNPNMFYNYIELRKAKMVTQYREYFPEQEEQFTNWFDEIKRMTGLLHSCYVNYFINHSIDRDIIPYELRPLCYELHGHHLNSGRKLKIERDYVINYFNSLPTKKIIFVINYRKNKDYHESKRLQGGLTADEIKAQIMSEGSSLETGASVEGVVASEDGSADSVE